MPALICGLLSLFFAFCCQPYGFPVAVGLAIAGIVFARQHQRQRKEWNQPPDTVATLALIVSIIGIVLAVLMLAWAVYLMRHPEFMQRLVQMLEDLQ